MAQSLKNIELNMENNSADIKKDTSDNSQPLQQNTDENLVQEKNEQKQNALLQLEYQRRAYQNFLLGDFDEKGKYNISKDIVQELCTMPKKLGPKTETGYQCVAYLGDKIIKFHLTFPEIKENLAHSFLYLDEEMGSIAENFEPISTMVGSYKFNNDALYQEYCFRAFNISEWNDEDQDASRCLIPENIKKRLDYLVLWNSLINQKCEVLEEAYFNKRMQLLNSDAQGIMVLTEFRKEKLKLKTMLEAHPECTYCLLNQILSMILTTALGQQLLSNIVLAEMFYSADEKYHQAYCIIQQQIQASEGLRVLQAVSQFANMMAVSKPISKPNAKMPNKNLTKKPDKPKNKGGDKKKVKKAGSKKENKPKDSKKSIETPLYYHVRTVTPKPVESNLFERLVPIEKNEKNISPVLQR